MLTALDSTHLHPFSQFSEPLTLSHEPPDKFSSYCQRQVLSDVKFDVLFMPEEVIRIPSVDRFDTDMSSSTALTSAVPKMLIEVIAPLSRFAPVIDTQLLGATKSYVIFLLLQFIMNIFFFLSLIGLTIFVVSDNGSRIISKLPFLKSMWLAGKWRASI
jgi:hypothetical protein